MSLFTRLSSLWRDLFNKDRVETELSEEMNVYLELLTEEKKRMGREPAEARREALIEMGGLEQVKERVREVRMGTYIESVWQDARYGARTLIKNPAFTLTAVITLALGIGANTAIFSIVNELLLRPLPFGDAERIVMLWEVSPGGRRQNNTSRANFQAWRERSTTFESMAAFSDQRLNLTGDGEPEEVSVQLTTPELFQVLGVEPLLGRTLMPEDARPDAPKVAVLSNGIWQRRYGGDPQVVGRTISLNGAPCTVVGVMPAAFQWHIKRRSGSVRPAEIWAVIAMPTQGPGTTGRFLSTVARLKPGVTLEQADAEMKTLAVSLEEEAPRFNKGFGAEVLPLREQLVGNVRPALLILLGAVGFVLLIACANVANLMLSRAAAREKEIAVRTALGASRMRVVRQLLTESLLLALLGSLFGLGLASFGIKALETISPREIVDLQGVGINMTVLGWTLAVSLLTGLIFGLAPALETSRLNLNDALKEGGKGAGGQGAGRRLRSALVVAEVALALVLLASAGLLVKSFARLQQIDTGFHSENLLTMVVPLSERRYREDSQVVGFFREANDRIRALPGVRSVGMVNYLPLYGGAGTETGFTVEGRPEPPPGEESGTNVRVADSEYFTTMGIPILRGRNFSDLESAEAKHVVLISEAMAREHFPAEDPLGKRILVDMFDKPTPTEIVGIVGDVRYDSLVNNPGPTVYFPLPELTYSFMTLVIRTNGDPAAMAATVRREIRQIDADQPVSDVRAMDQVMADTVGRARFQTLLLTLFAGLATLLAAVGIFGVMNYSVTLRRREIGIRIALGAQPGQVLRLVLTHGFLLTLAGVVIGLAGSYALTRLLSDLLYGVGATDPATFATIVLLLTVVAMAACYLPARRALKIDPVQAIRNE